MRNVPCWLMPVNFGSPVGAAVWKVIEVLGDTTLLEEVPDYGAGSGVL